MCGRVTVFVLVALFCVVVSFWVVALFCMVAFFCVVTSQYLCFGGRVAHMPAQFRNIHIENESSATVDNYGL